MATELFKPEQSLKEIHNELMEHLYERTSVSISSFDGKVSFYIRENGDSSWWFNDLVEIILQKAANGDSEIIKLCVEKGIGLVDVQIKKIHGRKKH